MSGSGEGEPPDVEWDARSEQPLLVDPEDVRPFNPLDTTQLGVAVVKALLEKRARPIGGIPRFSGAGIYVIYYLGDLPVYSAMMKHNADAAAPRWPIYVGKAVPEGSRKGGFDVAASARTTALWARLREHAKSVEAADNLRIQDFGCRFLVVQDLWIPLAEALLITHFAPVWNNLVDGFGNHDPGAGRRAGVVSRWDVLHPGRAWAGRSAGRKEAGADIAREVERHLATFSRPSATISLGDNGR